MSKEFVIGERVRVVTLPPYVKTAEPMPMLRPPDVIQLGEEGVVVDRRPGGYWSVRFARGVFLLDSQFIESMRAIADTEAEVEAIDERSHNVLPEQKYIVDPS
ncbi:MAG: regulatory protein SipA [Cyanobacteriota bacterium]